MKPTIPVAFSILAAVACVVIGLSMHDLLQPQPDGRPIATITTEDRLRLYQSGPVWDGRGSGRWYGGRLTEADAAVFDGFPLYWIGPRLGRFNLISIDHTGKHVKIDKTDGNVTLVYGTCRITRSTPKCAVPNQIGIEKGCNVRYWDTSFPGYQRPLETVRGGAQLQRMGEASVII